MAETPERQNAYWKSLLDLLQRDIEEVKRGFNDWVENDPAGKAWAEVQKGPVELPEFIRQLDGTALVKGAVLPENPRTVGRDLLDRLEAMGSVGPEENEPEEEEEDDENH